MMPLLAVIMFIAWVDTRGETGTGGGLGAWAGTGHLIGNMGPA
jgi:hypothetical protein